jgi:hypothetical protein
VLVDELCGKEVGPELDRVSADSGSSGSTMRTLSPLPNETCKSTLQAASVGYSRGPVQDQRSRFRLVAHLLKMVKSVSAAVRQLG